MLKVLACAVSIVMLPVLVWGQIFGVDDRTGAPQPIGTATIRGHVFAADTGRALRGARVQVTSPDMPTPRVTMTDLSGAYEFARLAGGRFTVSASMASYIGLSFGQTRPFEAGQPIPVKEGQRVEPIDLRLPRGGAIAGAVLDETGRPLIAATVRVWRPQFVRGTRRLISVGTGRTDDAGEFRVFGLQPGSYLVSASTYFRQGLDTQITSETGYAPTFYPGTRAEASATAVTVRMGQTTGGVTFTLDYRKVGSIAGATFFPDGQAARFGAALPSVRPFGRPDAFIPTTVISGDGVTSNFRAGGLAPGEYDVRAISTVAGSPPQGAFTRVTLNGENITDVRLDLKPLPSASGHVVVDPSLTAPAQRTAIRIATEPIDPWSDPPPTALAVTPADDLSFTVYAVPGRARIKPTLPKGWALKAVRVQGRDVTDAGIDFRSGETIAEIEVEITNRLTLVSGSARNQKGEPAEDYAVIVFSRERQQWDGDSRHFASLRADQQARFEISGLAPGDYYAVALDYLDPADAQDPALLERLSRGALSFSLQDRESKTLDLRLVQP